MVHTSSSDLMLTDCYLIDWLVLVRKNCIRKVTPHMKLLAKSHGKFLALTSNMSHCEFIFFARDLVEMPISSLSKKTIGHVCKRGRDGWGND